MSNKALEISPLVALRKRVYDSRKNNVPYETICELEGINIARAKILAAAHSKTLYKERKNPSAGNSVISSLRANIYFDINSGAKVDATAKKYGLTFDKCKEHYIIEKQRIDKSQYKLAIVRKRLASWNELKAIVKRETHGFKNAAHAMAAKSTIRAETMPMRKVFRSKI